MSNLAIRTSGAGPANADVEIEGTRACAEDIASGDILTVNASGNYAKFQAGVTSTKPRAVAPRAEIAGESLTGHRRGVYGGFSGLTPGADVFTSTTAGRIQNATATGAQVVGYAKTATSIYFDFPAAGPVAS